MSLQTIADQIGVSRMTVSDAFSQPDQLSSGLRARILAAADALGYVGPDPVGRALARGTTGAVGVLLTDSLQEAWPYPGDVSVVGFDDTPAARSRQPSLTTVRQDASAKGRAAARALIAAFARARSTATGPAARARHLVLPTELVERQSTAPPTGRSA